MLRHSHQVIIRSIFTGLLVLYVLAGVRLVPFHGDESTIIHKSRDWYLLIEGNLPALFYSATPTPPQRAEQELRLLNGVVSDYAMGFLSWLGGTKLQDVNEQWLWGADWTYNASNGHTPTDAQLFVARTSSALMTILSVAFVFAIASQVQKGSSAYFATLIYTMFPAVLLNGRRAMFEGATLLAITLVIATGLIVSQRRNSTSSTSVPAHHAIQWHWIALGVASGFALASKHILVITIAGVFAALLLLDFIANRCRVIATLLGCMASGALALLIFFLLNPAWWSAPLVVPGEVLRLRQDLAVGQVQQYGGYTSTTQRVAALLTDVFRAPQYYEDQRGWPQWIAPQIAAYEASGLQGIAWSDVGIAALYVVTLGLGVLLGIRWIRRLRPRNALLVLISNYRSHIFVYVVLIIVFIGIYILTPLPWQRYYLPLAAPLAIVVGAALATAFSAFLSFVRPLVARRSNAR